MSIKERNCTLVDPEDQELRELAEVIEENRTKRDAEQASVAATAAARQESLDQRKRQAAERQYKSQMKSLMTRIVLSAFIIIGVFFCWMDQLVTTEFFCGCFLICACVMAFSYGQGLEKQRQFKGGKVCF